MPRPSSKPAVIYNRDWEAIRHVSIRHAQEMEDRGEVRDVSTWEHGKGRTSFEYRLTEVGAAPEPSHSHSAITRKEMEVNAGAGWWPNKNEASREYEEFVRQKVAIWKESSVRWNQSETVQ